MRLRRRPRLRKLTIDSLDENFMPRNRDILLENPMPLTRDVFLSAHLPHVESVEVPDLGSFVHIRPMTAGERDAFEVAHEKCGGKDFRARIAAAVCCDSDGKLLFSAADIPSLSSLPASTLQPIVEAAIAANKLSASDIKDLEKNS